MKQISYRYSVEATYSQPLPHGLNCIEIPIDSISASLKHLLLMYFQAAAHIDNTPDLRTKNLEVLLTVMVQPLLFFWKIGKSIDYFGLSSQV